MAGADANTVGATAVAVAVGVAVAVEVAVEVAVAVAVAVAVEVAVGVAVDVAVAVAVGVSVAVAVAVVVSVAVAVAVSVAVAVAVEVAVAVAVSVAVAVAVSVAVAVAVAVEVAVAVAVAVAVDVAVAVAVSVAVGVAVPVAVAVGVAVAGGSALGAVVKSQPHPLSHSGGTVGGFDRSVEHYFVPCADRKVAQRGQGRAGTATTDFFAAIRPCPVSLSRKWLLLIVLQSIGRLKFTVMLVLTGTLTASSAGDVEVTIDLGLLEAAADPAIPTITTNAAIDILLTIYLSIIVIFFVENMEFISLVTCI